MITTGSKYLYGLGLALLVAAAVYAWGAGGGLNGVLTLGLKGGVGEPAGFFVLLSAAGTALFLGGVATALRDADGEAIVSYGRFDTLPETPAASGVSYWPAIAAFGLAASALGLVVGTPMFVLGLFVMGVAAVEWTVRAWADRATADPEVNRRIRNRLMHPYEVPLTGAIGIAVGVLAVSRVLLAVPETASWLTALILAAVVFGVAALLATRPKINRSVVAVLCVVGAVAVLAGGVAAAAHGHREFEKHTTESSWTPVSTEGLRGDVVRLIPSARTITRLAVPAAGAAVLASCGGTPQGVFNPHGSNADSINKLQVPVFIAAGIVGVLVAGGLAWVIMSGKRRAAADDEPVQLHGHIKAELTWTILPAVLLAFVALFTVITVFDISETHNDSLVINVYGQQWWWQYQYDLNNDGQVDITTANDLVIPAGRHVELKVQSRDVIHSFWIPALFGTRDAVPGLVHDIQFSADAPGVFEGQCKEFCGLSHANMRARAVVLDTDTFNNWTTQMQQPATKLTSGTSEQMAGQTTFLSKCSACHEVNGVSTPNPDKIPLVNKTAPDLTHLMSRGVFASASFPLWIKGADGQPAVNTNDLEAWLRDPPGVLPMAPSARGMPNLELSETEIDDLVAYLSTLGANIEYPSFAPSNAPLPEG